MTGEPLMNARWFKAIPSLAAGIMVLFSLVGTEASAKLHVVASFAQDASIVEAIGGDRIEVSSLTTGVQDPHAIEEPRPLLAVYLNQADLLIVNGLQMELAWLPAALTAVGNPRIQPGEKAYLDVSIGAKLIPYAREELAGTQFAPFHVGNHHYWLDPANGLVIAENISYKLAALDTINARYYKANYEAFTARLREKLMDWDAMMAPFKGKKIVSYHRDWNYIADRHGLQIIAYIEPRETIPPSAGELASLVKRMKEENISLILIAPWQPQRISREIGRQTGATVLSLPSAVDPRLGTKDYIHLFDVIYSQLARALSQ